MRDNHSILPFRPWMSELILHLRGGGGCGVRGVRCRRRRRGGEPSDSGSVSSGSTFLQRSRAMGRGWQWVFSPSPLLASSPPFPPPGRLGRRSLVASGKLRGCQVSPFSSVGEALRYPWEGGWVSESLARGSEGKCIPAPSAAVHKSLT